MTPAEGARPGDAWRKSSFSNLADCVEVARASTGGVLVRSSHAPDGPVIQCPAAAWQRFLAALAAGAAAD
jgi:uncharacterized protein DUF397